MQRAAAARTREVDPFLSPAFSPPPSSISGREGEGARGRSLHMYILLLPRPLWASAGERARGREGGERERESLNQGPLYMSTISIRCVIIIMMMIMIFMVMVMVMIMIIISAYNGSEAGQQAVMLL